MRKLSWASLLWAILVSAGWALVLFSHEGPRVVGVVAVPVLMALVGVLFGRFERLGLGWRRVLCGLSAFLLLGFVLVAGFSIGLYYFPSFLTMLLATGWPDKQGRST